VLLAITVLFFISCLIQEDMARLLTGQFIFEDQVMKIHKGYNLAKPIPVQFLFYSLDTLCSDSGTSIEYTRRL